MKIRPERVAHMIQREIADILANHLRDPRLSHWLSVTDVEVTPDLSFARVYVSILPTGEERELARRPRARRGLRPPCARAAAGLA